MPNRETPIWKSFQKAAGPLLHNHGPTFYTLFFIMLSSILRKEGRLGMACGESNDYMKMAKLGLSMGDGAASRDLQSHKQVWNGKIYYGLLGFIEVEYKWEVHLAS